MKTRLRRLTHSQQETPLSKRFPASKISAVMAVILAPCLSQAQSFTGHSLELKARLVQFDVDVDRNTTTGDFKQSALGLQLDYKSPYFNDVIGLDLTAYQVNKLSESSVHKNELLHTDLGNGSNVANAWTQMGQAAIKLKYQDLAEAKIGRQFHNSLLLKSTNSRAVPDTYSGLNVNIKPVSGLKIYGAIYDSYLPRNGSKFQKFGTEEATSNGAVTKRIDHIAIYGAQYSHGALQIDAESLNSKNYLQKYGVVGSYTLPMADKQSLKLSAGASTTSDAGSLFTCKAESDLKDYINATGYPVPGVYSCHNSGRGMYLAAEWKTGNWTVGGALAKFNGLWIEDNFAVSNVSSKGSTITDPGSNFFPTGAASGADMSNTGELARMVRVGYNWKDRVPGLRTSVGYKLGTGARNNYDSQLGTAKESEREIDVQYAVPLLKGLNVRYNHLRYSADVNGKFPGITGVAVKDFRRDHRIYLDYSHKFF